MKKAFLTVLCSLALATSSFAGFFLDNVAQPELKSHELPGLSFGALLGGNYYLSGVDAELQVLMNYRIAAGHSVGLYVGMNFPNMLYEVGGEYRWFFNGSPIYESDDFLLLGGSAVTFENFGNRIFAPRVTMGYGKDYRPFETSEFAVRFEIGGSYTIGEMLTREDNEFAARGAHTVLFIRMGVMY